MTAGLTESGDIKDDRICSGKVTPNKFGLAIRKVPTIHVRNTANRSPNGYS